MDRGVFLNQSYYIKIMKERYHVDFQEVWRSTLSHKSEYDQRRAFDDKVEAAFWKDHSHKYDKIPSLIDYAPEVFDRLLEITGRDKELIEFGCGTGKFTIPMSAYHKKIIGVDFSKDMLAQMQTKLEAQSIHNVELLHRKLEEVLLKPADVVYGINANYRMLNIRSAIEKMQELAKERVVIVWTMQRSPYDEILNRTPVKGIGRGQEYIQLLNVLYEMGIDPSMEMLTVTKPIVIDSLPDHCRALEEISNKNGLDLEPLLENFEAGLINKDDKRIYQCPLKVAMIYF